MILCLYYGIRQILVNGFCPYIIYMNLDQSKQTNIIENNLSIANIKYLCL